MAGGERIAFRTDGFAVVVCRHPATGKFLAVDESRDRGWWLPAGHVDRGQSFVEAAVRETSEEAGIDVVLKGVLAVEHSLTSNSSARMRVIFYAEPKDSLQPPKSVPDDESRGAAWMSLPEIEAMRHKRPPHGLRSEELLRWGAYVARGGLIAPLRVSEDLGSYDGFLRVEDSGPALHQTDAATGIRAGHGGDDSSRANALDVSSAAHLRRALLMEGILDSGEGDGGGGVGSGGAAPPVDRPINAKLWTPLHRAAAEDSVERARLLLVAGASPNAVTHKGRTPLHFAASRGCLPMVRLLLLAGADPDQRDHEGLSPVDSVAVEGHGPSEDGMRDGIVALLRSELPTMKGSSRLVV